MKIFAILFLCLSSAAVGYSKNYSGVDYCAGKTQAGIIKAITSTILWEGDSRTDQNEATQPPKLLAGLYNANFIDADYSSLNSSITSNTIKVVSLALSGDSLQAIRSGELSQGDSYAEGSTIIYILDAGVNDIGTGRTAAQAFDDFKYIAGIEERKGYIVYAATVCDANANSTIRGQIAAFNYLIRVNYPANRIIDFAKVKELNNFTNTKYFLGDGVHYTDAGKALKAQVAHARLTEKK